MHLPSGDEPCTSGVFFFFFEGKELILIPKKSRAKALTITRQTLK
jgi:hypothetical protein